MTQMEEETQQTQSQAIYSDFWCDAGNQRLHSSTKASIGKVEQGAEQFSKAPAISPKVIRYDKTNVIL